MFPLHHLVTQKQAHFNYVDYTQMLKENKSKFFRLTSAEMQTNHKI